MPDKSDGAMGCGCLALSGAIALVATVYFKPDAVTWFKPMPPVGRYQVVSGRIHAAVFGTEEVAAIVKIDTATGKSWVLFPIETANNFDPIPNRWLDVSEPEPTPSPSPKRSN